MRIAVVHPARLPVVGYGGTERAVWWLVKGLQEMGHEPVLVAKEGSTCPFGTVVPVDFENFDEGKIPPVDVVHYFFPPPAPPKRPYLVTIEGNGKPGETFLPNTAFVSRNHALRHSSEVFVYNGVDPAEYFFSETKSDYLLFLAKASWNVKNVAGAIRIAKSSRQLIRIVGGSRWWANPWGWARWEGSLGGEEKARIISSACGMLFPVIWHEPFGIAVVEAMVSGTPVLGSPFGSLPELIGNEGGAICSSEEEFVAQVKNLGDFKPHRVREWALGKFHYHEMTKSYLALYEKIANGEPLNASPPRTVVTARDQCQIPRRRS